MNLGADRPGESPQFYADVLRSLAILRKAVESEYQVPGVNGVSKTATLVEFYELDEPGAIAPWRKAVLNSFRSSSRRCAICSLSAG